VEISFKRNVGNLDRILRVLLGIVLLYLAAFESFPINTIWTVILSIIGIMMAIEGTLGY